MYDDHYAEEYAPYSAEDYEEGPIPPARTKLAPAPAAPTQPPQTNGNGDRPSGPGDWTLRQIQDKLSRPLPNLLESKKMGKGQKSRTVEFLPWYKACKVLDKYAPGWTWEVRQMQISDRRIFIVGRLTIAASDGSFYRESTGTEELIRVDQDGVIQEIAYGDPSSNAESMAFRRCCAKFGLALYLYDK